MSDETVPNANDMKRKSLRALLRDVTEQRDKLLAEYEAMALQVDESVREIDEDILQIRQYADKSESNERRAAEETARANDLARQLDEERRKSAGIADEFASFRRAAEQRQAAAERALALQPSEKSPAAMLWRAITLIACDCRRLDTDENPAGQPAAALVRPRGRIRDKGGPPRLEMRLRLHRMGDPARHRAMEMGEKRGHEAREQEISGAGRPFLLPFTGEGGPCVARVG